MITSTPVVIGAYLAGALLLLGGLAVVLVRSLRQAIVAFVACLLMVSAIAWLLDAPQLAVAQLAAAALAAGGLLWLPEFRAALNRRDQFSGQLIPSAIAAVALLVVIGLLVLRGPWHAAEPGTGTSWREYLVGGATAGLVLLTAAAGVLSLRPIPARHPGPLEEPAGGRRKGPR